jgi:hypothetical protein
MGRNNKKTKLQEELHKINAEVDDKINIKLLQAF